jgi:hypothetical protein
MIQRLSSAAMCSTPDAAWRELQHYLLLANSALPHFVLLTVSPYLKSYHLHSANPREMMDPMSMLGSLVLFRTGVMEA